MILKNRYDRVMENVEVTDEMHERIMKKINEVEFVETQRNKIAFKNYKRYLSIAACFAILLVGSLVIRNLVNHRQENLQQVVPDIMEYNSLDELSDAVNFKVCEIKKLPFEVAEVKYIAYWKELAQIEYINPGNTLVLRMAISNDDISGDFYDYPEVKYIIDQNITLTIKGESNKYTLAVWKSQEYSYSLSITNGLSESEMLEIVRSVQ